MQRRENYHIMALGAVPPTSPCYIHLRYIVPCDKYEVHVVLDEVLDVTVIFGEFHSEIKTKMLAVIS